MNFENSLEFAKSLDLKDELRDFKSEFFHSDENLIYMDGNSLGKLPIETRNFLRKVIDEEWGSKLIRSWNENWLPRQQSVKDKIAKIIGAESSEVSVCDSVSINLFKLVSAVLKLNSERTEILTDSLNFPSDIYILESVINNFGNKHKLKILQSEDEIKISADEIINSCSDKTALVVLSQVVFKSAYMYDVPRITTELKKKGIFVVWDLSHSVGSVPIKLNKWNCDFAIGCTYKYLNGGPGSPAFLYVNRELIPKIRNPIWGWFGSDKPFNFDLSFSEASTIDKFNIGTQPMISFSALETSLQITLDAGMERIRNKNVLLTDYMIYLIKEYLENNGVKIGSPIKTEERGSHISIQHEESFRICKALIENENLKVIPDFRKPNNIRLGVNSLYNSFEEVYKSIKRIEEILKNKEYEKFNLTIGEVT